MAELKTYEYQRYADIKRLLFIEKKLKEYNLPGSRILDIGCGNGIISRYLGSKGYFVLGIDVDQKAIEYANSHNKYSNVIFKVKNVEDLTVEPVEYDAIICSEVLEHLDQPSKLLQILYKILKPGGIMVVTVPNGNGPRELFVTRPVIHLRKKDGLIWKVICVVKRRLGYTGQTIQSSSDNLQHIQFFTKNSLHSLAKENNFKIETFDRSNLIDDVFPFSLLTRNSLKLQKFDAAIADKLPSFCTGGFLTIWRKKTTDDLSKKST